jgi:thioredoxin reductase (NADPH)
MESRKVVIVGSGCAGNTAAIYAARAGLNPLVLEGLEPGGQLSLTSDVENFPGFPEGIEGPGLIQNMKNQAIRFGADYKSARLTECDLSGWPLKIKIEDDWMEAHTLIVASGASAKWLGIPTEQKLIGKGVSSCATCDGFFYRGKEIMVVGGGDTAMEEALFLTRFGQRVTLVHRRNEFRASKIMLERVMKHPKIEVITNAVVETIHEKDGVVSGVTLCHLDRGETSERPVDGLFVAIGHSPNTKPFIGQLDLDADGYIVSHGGARTNVRAVYHAGDVQDKVYRQAITAAGAGCMAAIEAERFLEEEGE